MSVLMMSFLAWVQTQPGVTFIDMTDSEPEHGLVWVVLSTFVLIGIALLITIAIGAGAGFLRIWIARKFPHNSLNGPEYEPTTQLHLSGGSRQDSPSP